jgi:hypothetical protein
MRNNNKNKKERIHMKSTVFTSKAMTTLASEKQGASGWRQNDAGELEQVIFSVSGSGNGEWICAESYRRNKSEKRRENREFYKTHPNLLAEKIRGKKLAQSDVKEFGKRFQDFPWHAW